MSMPNCVPEYYRSMFEENDNIENAYYEALEKVKGMREISEYTVCTVCDMCGCNKSHFIKTKNPYIPERYFCEIDNCDQSIQE